MKKLLFFALCLMFIMPQTAFAAPADDIAGHYYYSDIKTYFFGAPITSYNLGGKTAIVCEDLNWHYNHDVYWIADERKLTVDKKDPVEFSSFQAQAGETLKNQDGITGEAAGDIHRSNIKTYLNGRLIDSYNIGGQTVIILEDIRGYGYDVEWDEANRRLSVTGNDSNFKMETDIGTVTEITYGSGISGDSVLFTSRLKVNGQPVAIEPAYSIGSGLYSTWFPLAPTLTALGAQWEWDEALNKFTVTSFDLSKIEAAEPLETETIKHLGSPTGPLATTIDLSLYCNEKEIPMAYTAIVGHWENMHEESFPLNAVVYEGIVYVPVTALADCLGLKVAEDDSTNLVTPLS